MNHYVKYGEDGAPVCWTRTEYTLLEVDGLKRVGEEEIAALEVKEVNDAEH